MVVKFHNKPSTTYDSDFFKHCPTTTLRVGGPKKSTTHFSFPKMDKLFDIKPINIDNQIKQTLKTNKSNKLFGDWDNDGILNFRDCKPKNKKKHGGEVFGYYLWQSGVRVHPDMNKKQHKQVRKMFEKNPELINRASLGIDNDKESRAYIYLDSNDEGIAYYQPYIKTTLKDPYEQKEVILIPNKQYTLQGQKSHPIKALRHELQHRSDFYSVSDEQYDREMKAREKLEMNDDVTDEAYNNLEDEQRARAATTIISARKNPVSEEYTNNAYRNLMSDDDGDGTPNILDANPKDARR